MTKSLKLVACLAALLLSTSPVLAQGNSVRRGRQRRHRYRHSCVRPAHRRRLCGREPLGRGCDQRRHGVRRRGAGTDLKAAQFLSNDGVFRIRGINDAASGQTVPGISLRLDNGRVGVGTTGPARQFEVEDTSTTGAIMRLTEQRRNVRSGPEHRRPDLVLQLRPAPQEQRASRRHQGGPGQPSPDASLRLRRQGER